jgi:8-oxo-dGTP diphosphatase
MMRLAAKIWKLLHLPTNLQLMLMRLFQDQFLIGVTGIITNDAGEILLFRHTYRTTDWGLPGGYIKSREHPHEGLEREIEEESGYVVSVSKKYRIRTDRDAARLDIVCQGKFMGGEFKPSAEVAEAGFYKFTDLPQISKDHLLLINKVLNSKVNPN